jgi:hypothetical protein
MAYAVANGLGDVTTGGEYQDSYNARSNGSASWALHAITGLSTIELSIHFVLTYFVVADCNAGGLVVRNTDSPTSSHIVSNLSYALYPRLKRA